MSTVLFWFRNDLRLHDQPALHAALTSGATHLLPVACVSAADEATPWGFARVGPHRRAFTAAALLGLQKQMSLLCNPLLICNAPPATALPQLAQAVGATTVVCEDIAAPYEQAEVAALRAADLQVHTVWHSSLRYSNQANWLYIAGRGTDPRGGRRFNPAKQSQDHDADGSYRRLWGTL